MTDRETRPATALAPRYSTLGAQPTDWGEAGPGGSANPHCALTTGNDAVEVGLDPVVEGDALRARDAPTLRRLAELWGAKYGPGRRFLVREGVFRHAEAGAEALVFRIEPDTAFGCAKGPAYSRTRWGFPA